MWAPVARRGRERGRGVGAAVVSVEHDAALGVEPPVGSGLPTGSCSSRGTETTIVPPLDFFEMPRRGLSCLKEMVWAVVRNLRYMKLLKRVIAGAARDDCPDDDIFNGFPLVTRSRPTFPPSAICVWEDAGR